MPMCVHPAHGFRSGVHQESSARHQKDAASPSCARRCAKPPGRLLQHLALYPVSQTLKTFNDNFGTLFTDGDRVAKRIREDIAPKVAANAAYQNAKENTPHTARMAHDQALGKAMQILLKEDTQIYKLFVENDSFRRTVGDMVYAMTS